MHTNLAKEPPIREIEIRKDLDHFLNNEKQNESRINPYLPSLSKTPAKIMDPATGASTWALGSHKCVKYSGVFTRKAAMVITHQIEETENGREVALQSPKKDKCPEDFHSFVNERRRGNEAVTVYMIRYILAWSRSG